MMIKSLLILCSKTMRGGFLSGLVDGGSGFYVCVCVHVGVAPRDMNNEGG